jgi:flagellar motility protein MotE (MotC chaperone)
LSDAAAKQKRLLYFWAKVTNSVEDNLQDVLSQTKQAQLENRLKDVAVLEEQMHQMLWGWKAELQAVPASSLLVCPLTFSSPAPHISEIVSARLHSN